jgi:aminomethyltransferase
MIEQVYRKKAEVIDIVGRKAVKNFGDLEAEYKALREGAMIYDCSNYGIYAVGGASADSFLEQLATKDIQYLNIGNICECYFLNEEAELVGSVFILRREVDFLIITPWEHALAVKDWLEAKSEKLGQVTITEICGDKALLSIEGPKAWIAIKNIFDIEIETVALRYSIDTQYENEMITILRIGRSSEYGYMILGSTEVSKSIYNNFFNKCQGFLVEEGGLDCLELSMLEVHQPNFIKETKEYGNILELSQQWYIQYDKEGYIGRERLMEIADEEIEKLAVGFIGEENEEVFVAGSNVIIEGECIGKVVYSLCSLKLNRPMGIAVLNNPYGQSGLDFEVETLNGVKKIHTISSPFVRPLSWDIKME